MKKKLIAGAVAGLALLATTAGAFAAPAIASSNVNVRSGPGTSYGVVDTLRRGTRVDVQNCRGSWCFVVKPGPDGWVSANYLDRGGRPNPGPGWNRPGPGPGPGWNRPGRPDWGWSPPPGRPSPGSGWNRPGRPDPDWNRPGRPGRPDNSQVCYQGPNGYFCVGS